MLNVHSNQWDDELLALLRVPREMRPTVRPSSCEFGHTRAEHLGAELPVGGMAGDQQAALFGQACFKAGLAKNTCGTGCFMLMHTGGQFQTRSNGLITTSAAQPNVMAPPQRYAPPRQRGATPACGGPAPAWTPEFALEGSVFIGGAVVQ